MICGADDRLLFIMSVSRYESPMTIDGISLFFTNNSNSIDIVMSKHLRYADC